MKIFSVILLLFTSFMVFAEVKRIPANDHKALAREGITVLSETHVKSSSVTNVPPVVIEIIKPSLH